MKWIKMIKYLLNYLLEGHICILVNLRVEGRIKEITRVYN